MHETKLRNELGSERVKKCGPCVQVESFHGALNVKCSKMSHQRSKKENWRKETEPINRSVWSLATDQFTALFHIYTRNKTVTVYHAITQKRIQMTRE